MKNAACRYTVAVVWCRGDAGPMTLNINSAGLSLTVVAMAMRTISRRPTCAQTFVVSAVAAMCTGPEIASGDHLRFKNTNGGRAHYIIESKVQWKPFFLPPSSIQRLTGWVANSRIL